jgi:hypothetical protein
MFNPDPENLAKRLREVGERALNLLIRCNEGGKEPFTASRSTPLFWIEAGSFA